MSMNSDDIDEAADILSNHAPGIAPYAVYLRDWKDIVNNNSDGWAYWRAGSQCAKKLENLVSAAVEAVRHSDSYPKAADFAKTLSPIKSMATKRNLPIPTLAEPAAPQFR